MVVSDHLRSGTTMAWLGRDEHRNARPAGISDRKLSAVVDRGGADQKPDPGAGKKHHCEEI
jgi:hypothetical protein